MKNQPDFFLTSAGESQELARTRACWIKSRLKDRVRDDHMLVEIKPPLIGQLYRLGGENITNLILSARHKGSSLFPIKEWPCHVYIARILDGAIIKTMSFTRDQVEIIAWGVIFRTLDEANAYTEKFSPCRS